MERSHSCSNFEAKSVEAASAAAAAATSSLSSTVPIKGQTLAGSTDNLQSMEVHFPPTKPLRKRKRLQRQQLAIEVDDDYDIGDDDHVVGQRKSECECLAYAGDVEEEDEEELDASEMENAFTHARCAHVLPQQSQNVILALQRHISRRCLRHEESFDSCRSSSTAPELSPQALRQHRFSSLLLRDSSTSVQSDSSRYSSVDSLLESRKPDPEAILINLGFGPAVGSEDMLSRIPKRFLKPSQVPGIDTEAFVKRLTVASSLADSSVLGYRGLTGNPDQPPSSIVAKIMERFEVNNQRKQSMGSIGQTIR
ncbi:uncharacterized protein Dwil_GK22233 [Drosophila willistoni]|uniref:ITPR-interacting domain-containing protein n=1 Tax=Drosophila willistoni TaxID=7260 RepID=B4MYJ0_DROWI|nr:uncharacterized protein LOC6643265 [Drosophila willistoni]EDW77179.1 uncharacterized protein Dwil_GK22233 [Drosophila willistoni]